MNDVERYVRWYARLAPDARLDLHAALALLRRALADREALATYLLEQECAPALLREFINRHWDDALDDDAGGASSLLASRTLRALGSIEDDRDLWTTLDCLRRRVAPDARILRRMCEVIGNA